MTTTAIREKLQEYIRVADDKKVKAIYTMVEDEIYDRWNDKSFIAELNKRSSELKSSKTKGISWEESKAKILSSSKKKKR